MVAQRLFLYGRTAKRQVALGSGILVVSTALELLQPWPIKWLIDYVFGGKPAPQWLLAVWPPFARSNLAGVWRGFVPRF